MGGAMPMAFHRARGRRPAAATLVCLPHAGGGMGAFVGWSDRLGDGVELAVPELPGRDMRLDAPLPQCLQDLAADIAASVAAQGLARPWALWGHSMGALLAFETARALRSSGTPLPHTLIVAAQAAPQRCRGTEAIHRLPDERFLDEVNRFEAMPPQVIADRELLELVLPSLRNDFALCETYRYDAAPPLDCPIVVFGGRDDPWVDHDDLAAWGQQTSRGLRQHALPGGHFFFRESAADMFFALLRQALLSP